MTHSFRIFMDGLIDYAGLFPPAELPLEEAITNYQQYRTAGNAWILGRFIIPSIRFNDLDPFGDELFNKEDPWRFSVLGPATSTLDGFEDELLGLVAACREFHLQYKERVITDQVEITLPKEVALSSDSGMVQKTLEMMAHKLNESENLPRRVFYEIIREESWKNDLEAVLTGISDHNRQSSDVKRYQYAGLKLRCGGTEDKHFPTPEQVAFTINKCREYDVTLKCTAGLHHPVRIYHDSVGTKMHGFFNVFGAIALGYSNDLSDEEICGILTEEDPDHFVFTDKAFAWNGMDISVNELEEVRNTTAISFGSCSFEEPVEDLQKLGYL